MYTGNHITIYLFSVIAVPVFLCCCTCFHGLLYMNSHVAVPENTACCSCDCMLLYIKNTLTLFVRPSEFAIRRL